MKRVFFLLLAVMIMFSLFVVSVPKPVEAIDDPVNLSIAPNSWSGGDDVEINLDKYPAPGDMQMLGKGVKVSEPGQICHDFRGGQYYWVGVIFELTKDGKWVEIPSTAGWYPTVEGKFRICADAPEAGTYALFAHFAPPAGYLPHRHHEFL